MTFIEEGFTKNLKSPSTFACFIECSTDATKLNQFHRVEGLITRGGIKPDDRPLWFDVYRAFPPVNEPKFAQPKPENKPIRQILYKEDVIREKFHSAGHGLGPINMLYPSGETPTSKLIQQYEQLKSEGLSEPELIEKCVENVYKDRQIRKQEKETIASNENTQTATSHVLNDVDFKNIFDDKK